MRLAWLRLEVGAAGWRGRLAREVGVAGWLSDSTCLPERYHALFFPLPASSGIALGPPSFPKRVIH